MTVGETPVAEVAAAIVPEEKTLTVWQLVSSGGTGGAIIMITLLILSILAVYIIIERFLVIKKASKEDSNFMNQIKDHILDGKIDAAKSLCNANASPIAKMIEKGVSRIGKPLSDIGTAVENTGGVVSLLATPPLYNGPENTVNSLDELVFSYSYDNNSQKDRVASTDVAINVRAIGLNSGQWVQQTASITRVNEIPVSVISAVERNYNNPT